MRTYDQGFEGSRGKLRRKKKDSNLAKLQRHVASMSKEQISRLIEDAGKTYAKGQDATGDLIFENTKRHQQKLQAKLEISQPEDQSEKQADKVAEGVTKGDVSISKMALDQTPSDINTKSEDAGMATTPGFDEQLQGTKGQGSKLDKNVKTEMEGHLGTDLSGVNIHTGGDAQKMSGDINAKAFAHGQDVYFNEGQYNPSSQEGKGLLAHELTHTVQQKGDVGRKVQRQQVAPPAITGKEKDGDISTDTNYVFNTKQGKWITTNDYITTTYKTSQYVPDQYIKQEWYLYWVNGGVVFQSLFNVAGKRANIDPIELFTLAIGEGLSFWIDQNSYSFDKPVSGYTYLGLDFFSEMYNNPNVKKYLPAGYTQVTSFSTSPQDEFIRQDVERNEAGGKTTVPSAMFKNLQSGIDGLAAVYASARDLILDHGQKKGYGTPTSEQKQFWSYYSFQSFEKAKAALVLTKGWDFSSFYTTSDPKYVIVTKGNHPKNISSKALKRIATTKYIKIKTKTILNVTP